MNSATAAQLLEINRRFYLEHAGDFADTRERVQPGVARVLASLETDDTILDLGCGNGTFARALAKSGHHGVYLGLDFSAPLLERASLIRHNFPVAFLQVDLASLDQANGLAQVISSSAPSDPNPATTTPWTVITAFALLHHIPGHSLRLNLLRQARELLLPSGRLILSNWQLSTSTKMHSREVSWSVAGIDPHDLDEGDHLVDWRRGKKGMRYVHEFRESELDALAEDAGFTVVELFYSDGADHHSGLYQVWQPA